MSGAAPRAATPGSVDGPGLLEVDQGSASVTFRRQLHHPIEDVWTAITDPGELQIWFMAKVRRENGPGGALEMEHPNGVRATGRVVAWDPPRTYEYEWKLPASPSQPDGENSRVRWDLSTTDGGTLLVLTHRRLSRPTAEVFARGLRTFLDRLAARLDRTAMPDPPWLRPPSRP